MLPPAEQLLYMNIYSD